MALGGRPHVAGTSFKIQFEISGSVALLIYVHLSLNYILSPPADHFEISFVTRLSVFLNVEIIYVCVFSGVLCCWMLQMVKGASPT